MTSKQAAAELGVTRARLHQFIKAGRLRAERIGRDLHITLEAVQAFRELPRKNGRPRKQPSSTLGADIILGLEQAVSGETRQISIGDYAEMRPSEVQAI